MPGMKVTLSAAMRARDVSRPRAEHEEAAGQADGPRPDAPPPPADPGSGQPAARGRPQEAGPGNRGRPAPGARGSGRSRRKRR